MAKQTQVKNASGEVFDVYDDYLDAAGFKRVSEQERETLQGDAADRGASQGGEYFLRGVYKKDDVTITFEVNTSTLNQDGMKSVVTYPQVCVVEGPKGRAACSADDIDLQIQLAEELS